MDWWRGSVESNPMAAYQAHLAEIRDRLPEALLWLQEGFRLHDATVSRTWYDSTSNVLEIDLVGDNDTDDPHQCDRVRRYELRYSRIVSVQTTIDRGGPLPGPKGYGDLGYTEVDLTIEGHFEHRLLFSSGIEMQIVFGSFHLDWEDLEPH